MRIVVTGIIGTCPVGGVAWDYGQYLLGLEQLGHEVWYLEDNGWPVQGPESLYGDDELDWVARYLPEALGALSPTLAQRWHYRHWSDQTAGLDADALADLVAEADVFLNLSSSCTLREEYASNRCRVLVETDPGVSHFVFFPRDEPYDGHLGWRGHHQFFTYAERLGAPDCRLPNLGVDWQRTRPPVVLDHWSTGPPGKAWTTVLSWKGDWDITDGADVYGGKEREFRRIVDLPRQLDVPVEVAVGGVDPPAEEWREAGWSVVDGPAVTATTDLYRRYIEGSRGELSVAKNVYVDTRSGWFSCRSACYLAAGRPVVVQDTGWTDVIPSGEGLFGFTTSDEAAAAVAKVEADWDSHSASARRLAEEYLSAEVVLGDLLEKVGRAA